MKSLIFVLCVLLIIKRSNILSLLTFCKANILLLAFTNHSNVVQTIKHLDKLAQMEITEVLDTEYIEVDELDETERGEGGIGSSGS